MSIARTVEAVLELRAGKVEDAKRLFREAVELGEAAGDVERQATALVHLALVDEKDAGAHVAAALKALDGVRLNGPGLRPDLEGEHPKYAAHIGVRFATEVERVFALMQRARNERLLTALRGRACVLDALLTPEQYAGYVEARANLMDARSRKQRVTEAEAAFDAMVDGLRQTAPRAASLAFPRPVAVAGVQAALKPGEALLCMLVGPYARRIVAITKQGATVREYDEKSPLKAFAADLEGVRQLIVVPDGTLSIDLAAWGDGHALDAFGISYVPSVAAFLHLRASPAAAGKGAARIGNGPKRLPTAVAGKRVGLLHIGTPLRIDLRHPQATDADLRRRHAADVVVLAGADVVRGGGHIDGLAAAAQAAILGGARQVILSLVGPPPAALWTDFYANCLDRGMTPAFALLQARRAIRQNNKKFWAGMVIWGVP